MARFDYDFKGKACHLGFPLLVFAAGVPSALFFWPPGYRRQERQLPKEGPAGRETERGPWFAVLVHFLSTVLQAVKAISNKILVRLY